MDQHWHLTPTVVTEVGAGAGGRGSWSTEMIILFIHWCPGPEEKKTTTATLDLWFSQIGPLWKQPPRPGIGPCWRGTRRRSQCTATMPLHICRRKNKLHFSVVFQDWTTLRVTLLCLQKLSSAATGQWLAGEQTPQVTVLSPTSAFSKFHHCVRCWTVWSSIWTIKL